MADKLQEIIRRISDTKTFSADSYLSPQYFSVFLLFGATEEEQDVLRRKAHQLVEHEQAYAFICISKPISAQSVAKLIEAELESASRAYRLSNLNKIFLCPVVFTRSEAAKEYTGILTSIDKRLAKTHRESQWLPFLLGLTFDDASNDWLDAIERGQDALGHSKCCRCCAMSWQDSNGLTVDQERLLQTILLCAFMQIAGESDHNVRHTVAWDGRADREFRYYSAQTVSITDPVLSRTLRRMATLFEQQSVGEVEQYQPSAHLLNDILQKRLTKLPREGDTVSLLPIFGVMADSDGQKFRRRLKSFIEKYYLCHLITNDTLYHEIETVFMAEFLLSGKRPVKRELDAFADAAGKIISSVRIAPPPDLTNIKKIPRSTAEVYRECCQYVQNEIRKFAVELFDGYRKSELYGTLPARCAKALDILDKQAEALESVAQRTRAVEMLLPLSYDPDEKWLDDLEDAAVRAAYRDAFNSALVSGNADSAQDDLYEKLYTAAKIVSSEQSYMALVARDCQDPAGIAAKSCITTIRQFTPLPIRLEHAANIREGVYAICANNDNALRRAWGYFEEREKGRGKGRTEYLDLHSDERFELLHLSSAFKRSEIWSVEWPQDVENEFAPEEVWISPLSSAPEPPAYPDYTQELEIG